MVPQIEKLQEKLCDSGNILEKCTPATLPAEYIDVKFLDDPFEDDSSHMQLNCDDLLFPFRNTPLYTVPVRDAKVLYDGSPTSKKFVELRIDTTPAIDYDFTPGDSIGVLISNSKIDVETVLQSLVSNDLADVLCEISIKPKTTKKHAKIPQHVPHKSSARAILRDCLELRSIPKKLFLRSLAEYTSDEVENKFLISISSKEGSKLYNELILEKSRTFLDLLNLCPSCRPPLSLLIEHLPRLRARPYSIANSSLTNLGEVKIIFSVLPQNPGVATSYLSELAERFLDHPQNPQKIDFYFRESSKFCSSREDADRDSILIGIGCGVSPFLGFLEQKHQLKKDCKKELGSTWLFVGSTNKDSAVHREQLLFYKEKGVLQEFYESFSRDTDCEFKYVQDQMKANETELVRQFCKKDTILYVCADGVTISKSISDCIRDCVAKVLECTEEEANKVIKDARATGKYREDIWV